MTLGKALPPQPPYTLVGKDESEQDVKLLPLSGDLRGGWEWEELDSTLITVLLPKNIQCFTDFTILLKLCS